MPATIGESDVLNYLMKTGPISLSDLALRFDDPPRVLRALNGLREREEVDLDQSGVLQRIMDQINNVPSFSILRNSSEAQSIVRLTHRGFRRAAG